MIRVLPRLVKQRPVMRETDRPEELTTSSQLAPTRSSPASRSLSCRAGTDQQGGEVAGDVSQELPVPAVWETLN